MKPIFLSRARTSDFGLGLCHKQDHEDLVERLAGGGRHGSGFGRPSVFAVECSSEIILSLLFDFIFSNKQYSLLFVSILPIN